MRSQRCMGRVPPSLAWQREALLQEPVRCQARPELRPGREGEGQARASGEGREEDSLRRPGSCQEHAVPLGHEERQHELRREAEPLAQERVEEARQEDDLLLEGRRVSGPLSRDTPGVVQLRQAARWTEDGGCRREIRAQNTGYGPGTGVKSDDVGGYAQMEA